MAGVDTLAAYGALVAAVVALWSVWNSWRASHRQLRVSASIGTLLVATGVTQPDYREAGRQVLFKAQNDGPVSVHVQSCGLATTKRRWGRHVIEARMQLTLPQNFRFPQDIMPGRALEAIAELDTFCGDAAPGDWAGYDRPYFIDAVGRSYLGRLDPGFLEELEAVSRERRWRR